LILSPAALAGLPNPCSLITTNEASDALGQKIVGHQARSVNADTERLCTWKAAEMRPNFAPEQSTLTVSVFRETKAKFDSNLKVAALHGANVGVPVHGIGQEAYVVVGGSGGMRVWSQGFVLGVLAPLAGSPTKTVENIAELAIHRL
jgi:hypothetical protein